MPKRSPQTIINTRPAVHNGELVSASTVVQVTQLALNGPFRGDFQIIDQGRLIVGEHPDLGERFTITSYGAFGYNAAGTRTFGAWTRAEGTHTGGDVYLGQPDNFLMYDQSQGTLGLYTAAGSGFIADSDGSLWVGKTDGVHMRWSSATRTLEIRNKIDTKLSLDANGNGFFDGTIYAAGGRIDGTMQVDGLLRAGDVDGPAVSLGRFSRPWGSGVAESSEIIATDSNNLPWFHVVAGGSTQYGGHFHLGGSGDYPQRLTYDGADLTFDGTLYARSGEFTGTVYVGDSSPRIAIDGVRQLIESTNFASGTSGFRIDGNGNAEYNNVVVRGAIASSVLQYGYVQATSGSVWVTRAAGVLSANFAAPEVDASSALIVSDPNGVEHSVAGSLWTVGDIVRIKEPLLGDWWGIVESTTDLTIAWQLSVKTANVTGDAVFSGGATVLNYGQGDEDDPAGVIRTSADASYSPYISISTHEGSPWDTLTERVRLGNLNGISGAIGYGLWTDNGYFTGTVNANDGLIGGWTITSEAIYTNYLETDQVIISSDGWIAVGSGYQQVTMSAADATYRLWAGHFTGASAPFSITKEGAVKATSGTVGGWTLGAASLTGGDATLHNTGYLLLGTGDNIVRIDASNATYRLWIGDEVSTDAPFSVTKAGAIRATSGTVGGWTLGAMSLSDTAGTTGFSSAVTAGDDIRLWAGHATPASAPFHVTEAGVLTASSGTVGGWTLGTDLLQSAASGARIVLDKTKMRISIFDATAEKVVMGYLNGLAMHDGTGNWGVNNYGFWAKQGDYLVIDGDGEYVSGDWIVQNDGSYLINDGDDNTIIRLGTDTFEKGLFLYDTSGTQLAKFVSDEVFIGEATKYLKYTAADGLEIQGTITFGVPAALNLDSQYAVRWKDDGDTLGGVLTHFAAPSNVATTLYSNTSDVDYNSTVTVLSYTSSSIHTAGVTLRAENDDGIASLFIYKSATDSTATLTADNIDINGTTTIDQSSSTAAVPVLVLDQADVSEEMIEFVSTAGTGNAIEAVGSKTLTTTHFIKVKVNGDTRYIPVGTIA